MDLHIFWYVVIGVTGLLFGSFFNVAIHRWPKEDPKDREWVKTPSNCPKCRARIRWYDNIPVISWIILQGKCRDCKAPISIRYPLIELGTSLLWLGTTWLMDHYGLTGIAPEQMTAWHIFFGLVFASLFFLTVFIDFETSLIPDQINYSFVVAAWLFLFICAPHTISPGWLSSLIGMLGLALFFFLLYFFGGMGDGDVFFALGMGALFGWKLVIGAGFGGILLGGIVAIVLIIRLVIKGKYKFGERKETPFGPYLAISSYVFLFLGNEIVSWYLSLF